MKGFGEKLRELRTQRKLTIVAVAEGTGYSKTSISEWELNKKEPAISALKAICVFLEVSADYLLGLTDY